MSKTRKKTKKGRRRWLAIVLIALMVIGIGIIIFTLFNVPSPKKLSSGEYAQSSQIFDRNGELLYEIYAEKRRLPVKLDEVPENLKKATLAIEDANFYKHGGFDIKGLARGLYRTIIEKRLQGGSTLTQQLVKNGLLTPERTLSRKFKEAVLTVATEVMYSKDEILEMYFNQTPYGGTLWGVQSAANGIFNKEVKDLTLAESALLAGLPASPTKYSPFSYPETAKARQMLVLERMKELKMISQDEYDKAKEEHLNYYVNKAQIKAPHFVFWVKNLLMQKYGIKKVTEGGLKITTTLDMEIQKMAEATVSAELTKLEKYKVSNGAALITEPKTGQILAMVGSVDYFSDKIDGKYNVTTALRQPGSSIKPINYAVGIETGKITAASVIYDNPTCFAQPGQRNYCPTNYGGAYHGLQNIRTSLASSLNIAAVKVLKINGLETFVASASAMGLSTFKNASDYGLSLTLGGGEVTMTDMATAYGVLANMGIRQDLNPIMKVVDKNGKTLEEYEYNPGPRVLSRETSYIIQQILSDDGARAMVFGRGSMLNIKGHPEVAVKTGTTNDMRDNWTIGYTQDYTVTTWVGNNDNSKMGNLVSGTTGAAPIWNKIMTQLLTGKEIKQPTRPAGIVGMNVCNLTGMAIPEGGCESHYEYFKKEFVPGKQAPVKQTVVINKDTGRMVVDNEEAPNAEWQEHLVIEDASGVKICLDCQPVEQNPDGSPIKIPAALIR